MCFSSDVSLCRASPFLSQYSANVQDLRQRYRDRQIGFNTANMDIYISGSLTISQWKCTNLIYLTILPFLSVFLCWAAHSSDLGMIIIGLRSLSCGPEDVMECTYTKTPTPAHTDKGANSQQSLILHLVSSARGRDWSLIGNTKEHTSCPRPPK